MSEEIDIKNKIAYVDKYIAENNCDDLVVKYFVDILNYICELENKFSKQRNLYKETQADTINLQQKIADSINFLDLFISDDNLSKYDTLKILMHQKKILKGEDK